MPNQATAVAGVRFEVQDESAIEKARRILEELCFKEELLQGTRRPKQHTSMLEYTTHAQKLKRIRSNLGKLNQKSNNGIPPDPIMQFDNRLALNGGTTASNHLPTKHFNDSQFAITRSHFSKPDNRFHDRLPPMEKIKWVPATTLNHFPITTCSQSKDEQQNGVRRIAILKSNAETVYANYDISGSGTAEGQCTAHSETAAATESLLQQDATGDSLIHGNHNGVKPVGAYIRLRKPDPFYPGILPRPGQGGIRKPTPRFALDITLPRVETDEHGCLSPCCEEDEEYDDDYYDVGYIENYDSQESNQADILEIGNQNMRDSSQELSDDAKFEQLRNSSPDMYVIMPDWPQLNACSRYTSTGEKSPTSTTTDTQVTDPNNSLSTGDVSASNDPTQLHTGSRSMTSQPHVKNKDGQKHQNDLRQTHTMDESNPSKSKFLEIYAKYSSKPVLHARSETLSTSFSDIKRDPFTPPTSPQDYELNSTKLTLRSILKPPTVNLNNTIEPTCNLNSRTHPQVKSEAKFRVRKVPKYNKQGEAKKSNPLRTKEKQEGHSLGHENRKSIQSDKETTLTKAEAVRTNEKQEINTPGHKDRKSFQDDFVNNLTPESYHKGYTVNSQPLPTHMKRILDNAMDSVPKSGGKDSFSSSKDGSRKHHRNVNVNQACEILDNIVDYTKQRDNGKVCRHGMFLSNCSVCIAVDEIQQRIKFNIKKQVQNKFQWNLLPNTQCEETKWLSDAPTASLSDREGGNEAAKLPAIKSTISVSEFRIIRKRKRAKSIAKVTKNIENGKSKQTAIKMISFNGEGNLETPAKRQNKTSSHNQNRHAMKRVSFAENNIYRKMIGYKMRLSETVEN